MGLWYNFENLADWPLTWEFNVFWDLKQVHLCYDFQNPTSPCSRVILFPRFSENLTFDLELKVTGIWTQPSF